MSEREPSPYGTDYNPNVVSLLIAISPFSALFAWFMMWIQGADGRSTVIVVVVMFLGCLGAAGVYRLRGAAAQSDAQWLRLLLSMITAFGRR